MKVKSDNIKTASLWKRVLILLTCVIAAIALCVTCFVVFGTDTAEQVPVEEVGSGEVSTSATTYTNRASGSLVGVINNGDVLNITTTGQNVRNYTLPQGTYQFALYGAQGGGRGSDNGGKGGYMLVRYTVSAASQLFYFSVGGKGTNSQNARDGNADSTRYAGGVNGGGNGSGKGGPGGGGGTDIRTGGSGTGNRIVVAAGGGGGDSTTYTQTFSSSGTLYQGASGCSSRHSSSYSNDEGGGGGGYYGGAVRHSDDAYSSYCGSNYAGSGVSVTTNQYGNNTGNGRIVITVVSVNAAPTTKSYTYNNTSSTASVNTYRGTGKAIEIPVTTIAQDTAGQTLYYTTAAGSDTAPTANNTYLYLNSTCTTLATSYLDWSWTNSQKLKITAIKRYPRNGEVGCTQNGRLTLYARVRDNYGSSASTRASAAIVFYLTVNNYGIDVITTSTNTSGTDVVDSTKGTYVEYSYGSGANAYKYRVGNSNSTSTTFDYVSGGKIYGTSNGIQTVFVPQPLTTGHAGFTINAADLFRTSDAAGSGSIGDNVGIKSVSTSSYTTYYSITYNANSTKYGSSGLYNSITIKPTSARPTSALFVSVTITAQECDVVSKGLTPASKTLTLVFKIANTRPYFASNPNWSGAPAEPVVTLNVGASKDITLSSFIKDPDGTTPTFVTNGGIKVPTNEYVCVTRDNTVISLKSGTNYNRGSTVSTTWQSGEGNTATGFYGGILAASGSAAASQACVTYSYPNASTIRFTARAATQYQYSSAGRSGDFYVLVRVSDPGEASDNGIWFPIAIKVNATAPTEPTTTASFDLTFKNSDGEATPEGNPIYLTPISYTDANGVLQGVGKVGNMNGATAQPFLTDADSFQYTSGTLTGALNDIVTINGTTETAALTLNNTQSFFKVELVDLYASSTVFANYKNALTGSGGRIVKNSDSVYTFKGLKITPLRSTGDYYYQIDVKTIDSLGATNNNVKIFFKVANQAVRARTSNGALYPFNATDRGTVMSAGNEYAINYTVETQDVLYITPYDLAYDFDTPNGAINPTVDGNIAFNSNPYDANFASAVSSITLPYTVKRLTRAGSSATSGTSESVTLQRLSFTGEEAFRSAAAQYAAYFTATMENSVTVGGATYNIPVIKITAGGRTSVNMPILRLTVSDGYSSVTVAVSITVRNAAPRLKPIGNTVHSVTAGAATVGTSLRTTRDFDISTYVEDIDGDTPSFVAGSVGIVAKVADTGNDETDYSTYLDADLAATDAAHAVYDLTEYIGAILAKDNLGNDVIRITGLSSTQLFSVPIYLSFKVTDGYRAQPQIPTLRIPVEVVNSAPVFVTTDLTEREEGEGYAWFVSFENMPEKALPRYIVNCPEVYNSTTAITAAPSNKMLLFSDADAKQRVLLNPLNGIPTQLNATNIKNLVKVYNPANGITAADFETYRDAAVLYTSTYAGTNVAEANQNLDVSIVFFGYKDNALVELQPADGATDMWAIKIVDRSVSNETGVATQIAIAVKDNHEGADLYRKGESIGKGDSDVAVLNFYYQYQSLGLTVMHDYYRTDGRVESATPIVDEKGEQISGKFNVDITKLYPYQFDSNSKPTSQSALASADFTDDFTYQYFINTTIAADGKTPIMASKSYASSSASAFYYKPIEIAGGTTGTTNTPTIMPISYIAMPSIYNLTEGTENSTHVTFANVGANSVLKDGVYLDWGSTANNSGDTVTHNAAWASETRRAVFENLTLSDGSKTWSGALPVSDPMYITNNPYIDIAYVASNDIKKYTDADNRSLINQFRATLTDKGDYSYTNDWKDVNGVSKFREDKFGFSFTKKNRVDGDSETGKRFAGTLKFSVNLKTNGDKSVAQAVSVDIVLRDSEPTNFKYSGGDEASNRLEFDVDLTTRNSVATANAKAGTTIKLVYGDPGSNGEIGYRDPDTTDEARFFMPSASDKKLSEVLTAAELDHISVGGDKSYYLVNGSDTAYNGTAADFVPNPGYEKFFTVSPASGTTTQLQIIPVAKTALNETSDLAANHLERDAHGIFYPFKVLVYDDLDDTGFTNGCYMPVLIKVYITNDPLAYTGKDRYGKGDHANAGHYSFNLVKGISQSVDVSSFLSDYDIVMNGQSLALATDTAYTSLTADEKLVKDYLVMPSTYTVLSGGSGTDGQTVPIHVDYKATSTVIKFEAQSAFKDTIDLLFTFRDSGSSSNYAVEVVISVKYENELPSANTATFGGANSINVTMKRGDSFTLLAADASTFATDKIGSFKSPDEFDRVAGNEYPKTSDGKYMTAEQLIAPENFHFFTESSYPATAVGDLGSLVVGSDDAPSTLRFITNITGPVVGSFSSNQDMFSVTAGMYVKTESSLDNNTNATAPMSVTVTARGVATNVAYTVTFFDHAGNRKEVTINITVLSTAPTVVTDSTLPTFPRRILTVNTANDDYTYSTTLEYGESVNIALNTIVTDVDLGDSSNFVIPDAYDGTQFKISNPADGVSALEAKYFEEIGIGYINIKATDMIATQGKYADLTFRVADPHGVQSPEITIRVSISPRTVASAAATVNRKRTVALDSYAEFAESGERKDLTVIAPTETATTLFVDADCSSLSAVYNVTVYALYNVDDDGVASGINATAIDYDDPDDKHIILRRVQAYGNNDAETKPGRDAVYDYISKFVTITVSDDGKTLTFTPVSATIPGDNNGRTVTPLNFIVRVSKSYFSTVGGNTAYALDAVNAYLDVSVANSTPVAVENSAINFGYPLVGTTARVSDFRSFTGSAGDSLTWQLYNTEPDLDENFGLFYDYDLLNNPNGNETLTYTGYSILSRYELGDTTINTVRDAITPEISSTGPVLTVSESQGKITIKINRKVKIAQPLPTQQGKAEPYSDIPVEISCMDTLNARATGTARTTAKTVIVVRVMNDTPDFKTVSDQDGRRGYSVTLNEQTGEYEMRATIKTGDKITVNYSDIIDDADFDMDAYFFANTSTLQSTTEKISSTSGTPLFAFGVGTPTNNRYGISTVSSISFTCTSAARGATAETSLVLCDSTLTSTASRMQIYLTVGNTAPTPKEDNITINIVGKKYQPPEGVDQDTWEREESAGTFNIVDFMNDINPDDLVNMDSYDATSSNRPYTYLYIDNIVTYTTSSEIDRPVLSGPAAINGNSKGEEYDQACAVGWTDSTEEVNNNEHQKFDIFISPGLYGVQKVVITVSDSGYLDGAMNYVSDGETCDLHITIVISRPMDEIEVPAFGIANRVTRELTAELLLNTADEPHNADGYVISNITTTSDALEITEIPAAAAASVGGVSTSAVGSTWTIKALYKAADTSITVEFNGDPNTTKVFNVNILDNNAPVLKNIENIGIFQVAELNDKYMITITPERWFDDPDVGDVMSFNSASVKVSAYAEAHLDGRNIVLLFKGRGNTDLTVGIQDCSGTVYTHTIEIGCSDIAQLSMWNAIVASIQSNVLLYAIIAGGVLLLIILLIIILVVVHKKRKIRREIEALLDSEAELEEEMLRLSGGGMAQYQSYGYLPPTNPAMNDPGLMLGSAPNNPTPNSLQLGAGTGQTMGASPIPPQQPVTQNIPTTGTPGQPAAPADNGAAGGDGFDPNSF